MADASSESKRDYAVGRMREPEEIRPARLVSVLLMFVVAAVGFWWLHRGDFSLWWLEDLPVYAHALRDWQAGRSPYNAELSPLYFLYPPAFLYMAGWLSHLVPEGWGAWVYVGAHVAAVCAIPLVLARYFFRRPWLGLLLAELVFVAEPRFTALLALCGANVASLFYCLAFAAAVPGLRRNRWELFYLVVFLGGITKITFLALLLLPVLIGKRQWGRSIVCGVAVAGTNLAEQVLLPGLYAGYQWSVLQAILVQRHYGYGVFGVLAFFDDKRHHAVGLWPYAVSALLALGITLGLLVLRRRLEDGSADGGLLAGNAVWVALVVMAVVLVNPREMQYDVDIALFAAFVVFVTALRVRWPLLLMVAWFLPSLVVPRVIHSPVLYGVYETLLVLGAFGVGYWWLWRGAGRSGFSFGG
ncbi:hypothetical protein [Acidicapsa ligni]|uniref:hypothetical protein n=1 Tax=Acidicapsa ligni TaxID=542300 RepID=UPI0021E04213|nr:hypothetical protein [Acidicapsa ligni]